MNNGISPAIQAMNLGNFDTLETKYRESGLPIDGLSFRDLKTIIDAPGVE